MRVKWKKVLFPLSFLMVIFTIYSCTTNTDSTISGKLSLLTGENHPAQRFDITDISIQSLDGPKGDNSVHVPEEADFVPGEIIVKYKKGINPSFMTNSVKQSSLILEKGNRDIERGAVDLLKLSITAKSTHSINRIKQITLEEVDRLNSIPEIEYAEPNYIYRASSLPDDTDLNLQWHYPLIKLDKFWTDDTLDAVDDLSSVSVAVIDTGVARQAGGVNHPDLDGIFRDEYDFVDIDSDATDLVDFPYNSYHGTHVIGTIGALTNNGDRVAGVAGGNSFAGDTNPFSGVRVIPLRALDSRGNGTAYDIAQAIRYASGLKTDLYPIVPVIQKADIINLSLGGGFSQYMKDAITEAYYDQGVTIVASAGNEYSDLINYPAAYPEVIAVSAVDLGAEKTEYSSYGSNIDITAPGGEDKFDLNMDGEPDGVYSTLFNDTDFIETFSKGTSMSAPHVSGAAALVIKGLQENPASPPITPLKVKTVLFNSAIDLGNQEFYGWGLLNAHAAVSKALGQPSPQIPVMHPFPKTVRIEGPGSTGSFILKNIGNNDLLTIDSITVGDDPDGLISDIWPPSGVVDLNGLEVQLTFNTNGHQDGKTYSAIIDITDSTGAKEQVYAIYKYIGVVYVIAFDSLTLKPVKIVTTSYEKGYEYTIDGLSKGSYIIGASTDRINNENDIILFESGEVFGFYASISNQIVLNVRERVSLNNVDFLIVDESL